MAASMRSGNKPVSLTLLPICKVHGSVKNEWVEDCNNNFGGKREFFYEMLISDS